MAKLPDWVTGILASVAIPVIVKVVNGVIPEDDFRKSCRDLGAKLTKAGNDSIGGSYELVETFAQKFLNIAVEEINNGLDSDEDVSIGYGE